MQYTIDIVILVGLIFVTKQQRYFCFVTKIHPTNITMSIYSILCKQINNSICPLCLSLFINNFITWLVTFRLVFGYVKSTLVYQVLMMSPCAPCLCLDEEGKGENESRIRPDVTFHILQNDIKCMNEHMFNFLRLFLGIHNEYQ